MNISKIIKINVYLY